GGGGRRAGAVARPILASKPTRRAVGCGHMMVGKRHSGPSGQAGPAAVPLYGFQPPVGTPYNLEVNTVEDFFAQHDDWPWNPARPLRVTFHYLIAITEGELLHDVDYVTR